MKTNSHICSIITTMLLLFIVPLIAHAQTDTTWSIHRNIIDTTGWMHLDSIRVRVIHVGDSSTTKVSTNPGIVPCLPLT
jgi:hypothetical protein